MRDLLQRYWFLICAIPYLGFWTYGLSDLDEGFYGAVTMDMLRRGDWVTPTLNGTPWFEKPILAYWLSMPLCAVLPNEFMARLPSFLCTMATAWVLYRFVKKQISVDAAILTALVFCTSILTVGIGRMMMTDAPLVLCMTVAFTTFYESILGEQKLRLATAAALGFAVLAKGPVALALFGLVGIFSFWLLPDFRRNWGRHWVVGTLLVAGIVALWYVPCYMANGQLFIQKFLVEQNIGRFRGGDKAHTVPAWASPVFFPATLAVSFLPWIVGAFRSKFWKPQNPLDTYLLIWACAVTGFFTLSGSKLVHYVLPAIPPLAALVAIALLARHPRPKPVSRWVAYAAVVSVLLCAVANYVFYTDWSKRFKDVQSFAVEAREKNLKLYQSRLGEDTASPTDSPFKINDSGHPSLGFYYREPVLENDNNGESNAVFVGRRDAFLNAVAPVRADQYSHIETRGNYSARINEPREPGQK